MKLMKLFVAVIWLCSGLFSRVEAQTQEKRQPDAQRKTRAPTSPLALPGAKGPPWEYVGKDDSKVTGACVGIDSCDPGQPPKTRTFPSGTKQLDIELRFEKTPGADIISIEVYNKNGKVEMAAGGWVQLRDVASGELTLSTSRGPQNGTFIDGPYQAKVKLDAKVVAIINWEIGEPKQ